MYKTSHMQNMQNQNSMAHEICRAARFCKISGSNHWTLTSLISWNFLDIFHKFSRVKLKYVQVLGTFNDIIINAEYICRKFASQIRLSQKLKRYIFDTLITSRDFSFLIPKRLPRTFWLDCWRRSMKWVIWSNEQIIPIMKRLHIAYRRTTLKNWMKYLVKEVMKFSEIWDFFLQSRHRQKTGFACD